MYPLFTYLYSKRTLQTIVVTAIAAVMLAGCSGNPQAGPALPSASPQATANQIHTVAPAATEQTTAQSVSAVDEQPSTVFYEIFVRSFYDSDGDGIGDLKGVTAKLDYLNDGDPATTNDLGIGGIWLMPINPSPSYHGYDVTDYRSINPDYGTLEDLQELVQEAHQRGIKVIMDLVVNHTSKEHPWFVDSANNKEGKYRNWYIWAEDQNRTASGTSAAGSGNPWHSLLGAHYMGTFWDGMPDLNFDNPAVRIEMKDIGQFWLKLGVDGFRLDAAKHIYEDLLTDKSEATTAKNVAWWQEFRNAMNTVNPHAYIVGEVWENSAVSVGAYLNQAFDSGFNFGLAEILLHSAEAEQDSGAAYTLERTYKLYSQISNDAFTDAVFLTNHDQNRVMSQLQDNLDHAKMAAAMLLTLPGNPYIYYGEEIGMLGVKPDEGLREPMRWVPEVDGKGQTTWEAAINNTKSPENNVKSQSEEDSSLLGRYRELISIRNAVPALRDGGIRDYTSGNTGVMAYERVTAEEQVLVLHNLTGKEQLVLLHPNEKGDPYSKILKHVSNAAVLDGVSLTLPPYSSVILD